MIFSKKNSPSVILILFFLNCSYLIGQQTFSKVYDLEVGLDNRSRFLHIENESFLVASGHSGDSAVVSALTRFDFKGKIVDLNSYLDFVINGSRTILPAENGIEIAGYRWSKDKTGARGLQLIKVNNDLDFEEQVLIHYEKSRTTNLPGILDLNDSLKVVYGSFILSGPGVDGGVYIGLLDKHTDSIHTEIIFKGEGENEFAEFNVYDLQETKDGNMLFIAEADPPGVGPGNGSNIEIIKFNWEGEILKKITFNKNGVNKALTQDKEGSIYFYNKFLPFFIDSTVNFPDQSGGIIKLNAEMDSVEWSMNIEDFYTGIYNRSYTIYGISDLEDGNLLAAGKVFGQIGDCQDIIECLETVGFLCKFTKSGEILWMREYGIPIPEEYVDLSLVGVLQSGILRDCKEMEGGRLLCIGQSAYAKPDISFYNELWLLMLDENGCLEPDCEATNILSSSSTAVSLQAGTIYPNPVSDILYVTDVSYDQYKIHDLMGRLVQQGEFTTEIVLSEQLSSGMYVLQLKKDGRLISVFKFMKE